MAHLTYLIVLLACVAATVPLDRAYGTRVFARIGRLSTAVLPVAALFTGWDLYAISRHQWTFNPRYVTGLRLPGRLPVEELLFFLVVPVAAILTFEAVRCRDERRRRTDPVRPMAEHENSR